MAIKTVRKCLSRETRALLENIIRTVPVTPPMELLHCNETDSYHRLLLGLWR